MNALGTNEADRVSVLDLALAQAQAQAQALVSVLALVQVQGFKVAVKGGDR